MLSRLYGRHVEACRVLHCVRTLYHYGCMHTAVQRQQSVHAASALTAVLAAI
jgi:hypothetical protein